MPKKTKRNKTIKFGRIILLSLSLASWTGLIYSFFFVRPESWQELYYLPFLLYLNIAIGSLCLLLFKKIAPAVLLPLGLTAILVLRFLGIKDWLNPLLIIATVLTLIYFFTVANDNDKLPSTNSIKQSDIPAKDNQDADIQKTS
jgi:hypothetical protein